MVIAVYRWRMSNRLGTAALRHLPTCTHPLISSQRARRPEEYRRKDNYRPSDIGRERASEEETSCMTLLGLVPFTGMLRDGYNTSFVVGGTAWCCDTGVTC